MTIDIEEHKDTKLKTSEGVFNIMHQILMQGEENDQRREHFWVISLFANNRIMNIELISLGSITSTIVEPNEVFSVPVQKKASKIILVHNHPSGELIPSFDDKDITDRLIQCGDMLKIPVVDHIIITTEDYYSFGDTGLLVELQKSTKYGIDLSGENFKHWTKSQNNIIAEKLIMNPKLDLKEIQAITGLTIRQLEKMKKELFTKKSK